MNILFLTITSSIENIDTAGIYTDLMRKFRDERHNVYVLFPRERRLGLPTQVIKNNGVNLLGVRSLNVTKSNLIEKGLGQLILEFQFEQALKNFWGDLNFDLILYSTPPITFTNVIKYVKRNNPDAVCYLLLKDIFPQNAVDLGMISKTGFRGLLYKYFRHKEKKLYKISDYIGCMSPANVKYLLKHNPYIQSNKVEIAPNSYEVIKEKREEISKETIREKYGLPHNKPIFIYGGNMGKPQGVSFLVECLDAVKNRIDCHFLLIGSGTEYFRLENWINKVENCMSVSLIEYLPKEDYDQLASACDVGLIFLDYRFSIPNYPSRLLPYLMAKKPIIAVTDTNCDTGTIAEANNYGFWCPSNSVQAFVETVDKMLQADIKKLGENGYRFYLDNYTIEHTYNAIIKHINY